MSRPPNLSSTSYAVLGLLAVQSWTTHELVQQVDHSLRRMWPRAQSKLYEEPKKLVAHGYAKATDDPVGRRRRTRYSITPAGRRALRAWVREPGDGPLLEFEQLLKIHFADSGTKADVLANLEATRQWVLEQNRVNLEVARAYVADDWPFPRRAALNQIPGVFLTELYAMLARWVVWATETVEEWPDDVGDAPYDRDVARRAVEIAESIETMLREDELPTRT